MEPPAHYPPDPHLLRDLRLAVGTGADDAAAELPLCAEVLHAAGSVRAGVVGVLVDVGGAGPALGAVRPDWLATRDLSLQLLRPVASGTLRAHARLLQAGRQTAVIEVEIRGGADARLVAMASASFARMPARTEYQRGASRANHPTSRGRELGLPGSRLTRPVLEQIGARLLDASAGALEVALCSYVVNSLGAVQGGVLALLADAACEAAAASAAGEPRVCTDLSLRYLRLGRTGPFRSAARVLRASADAALVAVEIRDAGRGGELVTAAQGLATRPLA